MRNRLDRLQDDGSLALVTTIDNPPPGIPAASASLLSADEAIAYFPEYADRITAALEGRRLTVSKKLSEREGLSYATPHA